MVEDQGGGEETEAETIVNNVQSEDLEHIRNMIVAAAIIRSKRLTSFEVENANLSSPALLDPFHHMIRDNYSLEKA